jgi:selenocysteine lyase/cysteine desulfurase
VQGIPSREVCIGLAHRGVFASHGNFYAQTLAERLGQTAHGLVRLGCACYTTEEEVERAVEGVRTIAKSPG